MEPIIHFSWTGEGGPKEVYLYMVEEETLADDATRVRLCKEIQGVASLASGLSTFEAGVRALAGENDLDATFYAKPDHSDPFGQRVSIGLMPRRKGPESFAAWGDR